MHRETDARFRASKLFNARQGKNEKIWSGTTESRSWDRSFASLPSSTAVMFREDVRVILQLSDILGNICLVQCLVSERIEKYFGEGPIVILMRSQRPHKWKRAQLHRNKTGIGLCGHPHEGTSSCIRLSHSSL
jgi:hypothetical protein